jgi:hypothetical protein
LTSAVKRRRRASGSIRGIGTFGIGDSQQIIEQQQILRVGVGELDTQTSSGSVAVEVSHSGARAQQARYSVKRNVAGVGFTEGPKHLGPATSRHCNDLPGHAALADARGPTTVTTPPRPLIVRSSMASRSAISQLRPTMPVSARPTRPFRGPDAQQPAHRHRIVGPLDAHQLGVLEDRDVFDQDSGCLTERHAAGRGDRFHSLSKPDGLADRGVTHYARADLTGNDSA